MYNENENNDLGRTTPEEHKEEPITTNFTMRDRIRKKQHVKAAMRVKELSRSTQDRRAVPYMDSSRIRKTRVRE